MVLEVGPQLLFANFRQFPPVLEVSKTIKKYHSYQSIFMNFFVIVGLKVKKTSLIKWTSFFVG